MAKITVAGRTFYPYKTGVKTQTKGPMMTAGLAYAYLPNKSARRQLRKAFAAQGFKEHAAAPVAEGPDFAALRAKRAARLAQAECA